MNFSRYLLIEGSSHATPVMIRGLGHRSGTLKSYFVEHIMLIFLKYIFFKKWIYVIKSNYFKITSPPKSNCFISPINIHEYTATESKYTSKIGRPSMWEQMGIILRS